jgi:hypothetical protein
MAFTVSQRCRFPNDLEFAAKQLDVELTKRVQANQALLKDAESAIVGLDAVFDEGTAILDSFFTLNDASPSQRPSSEQDNLTSPDNAVTVDGQPSSSYDTSSSLKNTEDVANTYGLLPDKSTEEQDEKFITNAGIILFDNTVYLFGSQSDTPIHYENIKLLRRLYFTVDANLKKTKEILDTSTKTVFIHNQLYLKTVPSKTYDTPYSVEEIKELLNIDYITPEDVAVASDNSSIVLLKFFISMDKSVAEVLRVTRIPAEEIVTNVFHFESVDNSTAAIARYVYLGYTGIELGAILAGEDLVTSSPVTITDNIEKSKVDANKLIQYIDFLKPKYDTLSTTFKDDALTQIRTGITDLIKTHKRTMSLYLFQVSTIQQKDIITELKKKHTDEKIDYLLKKRPDCIDLWFGPPDEKVLTTLKRTMDSAPTGSTFISNKAVNAKATSPISQNELVKMYADLYDAMRMANEPDLTLPQLDEIRKYLSNFLARNPEAAAGTEEILQGQPSAETPSGILMERMDAAKTLDLEQKKKDVTDAFQDLYDTYPKSIAGPLADIINKIADLFEKVVKVINKLVQQAQNTLLAMKKRLDSFMSKFLSLTGNASFSNSLLKCAVNWDIGLSVDILDRLFDFFFKAMGQILAFLSKLKKWISDILEKLLCYATDLLNNILGQVSLALPSACKIPRFYLGANLDAALTRLKNVSTAQTFVFDSCSKDIAKLRIAVRASTDKLFQFKESSNCASTASSNFMNAAMLNVGVGI